MLNMSDRPITLPRLSWYGVLTWIISTELIQTITTTIVVIIRIVRDCGKNVQVIQIPVQMDLHRATDIKNTARIETQRLFVTPLGAMDPWIPSKAIAFKSATAEFWDDPCQRHVEITSQDVNAKIFDLIGQSIPELIVYSSPLHSWC